MKQIISEGWTIDIAADIKSRDWVHRSLSLPADRIRFLWHQHGLSPVSGEITTEDASGQLSRCRKPWGLRPLRLVARRGWRSPATIPKKKRKVEYFIDCMAAPTTVCDNKIAWRVSGAPKVTLLTRAN